MYETGDVDRGVTLLTEDVRLVMPPVPLEYRGRDLAARFHAAVTFHSSRTVTLVATRANGQPAFGMYVHDPVAPLLHANGLLVLTLAGDRIAAMTRFDNTVLPRFGLPRVFLSSTSAYGLACARRSFMYSSVISTVMRQPPVAVWRL